MLGGKKAMAAFCRFSTERHDPSDGQDFGAAIEEGKLEKRRFFVDRPGEHRLVYEVYFLKGEEWRYLLFKELKKSLINGWNIDKEIIESILLDYKRSDIVNYIKLLERRQNISACF